MPRRLVTVVLLAAILGLASILALAACSEDGSGGGDTPPALASGPGSGSGAEVPRFPLTIVEREGCLDCHASVIGLAPAHRAERIGCSSCHLGNPWSADKRLAHRDMARVPGNLDRAAESCGQIDCHPQIVARVAATMMADGRGIVGVDRWVFGEIPIPDSGDGLTDLGDSLADSHLRSLCLPCHLAYPKEVPAPITELSRGGGCTACHLNYHADAALHPALDLAVTDDHCFGCHSRSGRISTNYEGWHETVLDGAEIAGDAVPGAAAGSPATEPPRRLTIDDREHRRLEDGRLFVRQPEDVHHTAGLSCIDCHTARETMGDGRRHRHQEEQIEIACGDCHRSTPATSLSWDEIDAESRAIVRLRQGRDPTDSRFVVAERSGLALINVLAGSAGGLFLEGKLDGLSRPLRPPAAGCELDLPGHQRLACQACHSGWVPQCLGCHTQRTADGDWEEFRGSFLAEPPTLGVSNLRADSEGRIRPFTPAMIFTLNTEPADLRTADSEQLQTAGVFHRLFAPATPHTTQRRGRPCRSCHNDPLAIGYGRGELRFGDDRRWTFAPTFGLHRDGLPADAWIAFPTHPSRRRLAALQPAGTPPTSTQAAGTRPTTTRAHARPFSVPEQESILRVGTCLTCHDPDPGNMERIYRRFREALTALDPSCRLPVWPAPRP